MWNKHNNTSIKEQIENAFIQGAKSSMDKGI